jgi:flagellar P-ring protein FlgI
MKKIFVIIILILLPMELFAASRIKDIVDVEGVRDNLLLGYGLVVGLNGTGDNLNNSAFTQKGLTDFLERLGVNTRGANLKTKNVAAVMVTGVLPPFARQGTRVDVNVSTLGDAKSLQDGTLLATPLLGADGQVYAVSQGQIVTGGFTATAKSGSSVSKNVTTNATIVNGAIIEKEISFNFNAMDSIKLALKNPDVTTAMDITNTINSEVGRKIANALDPGTVLVTIPIERRDAVVEFLADIEQLTIAPDTIAKIILDESSGTIVMGDNVRISPVAIAQGNLTITIRETPFVSQPNPFAPDNAETIVAPNSDITVDEGEGNKMAMLGGTSTLGELVDGLNALGVGPRDLITIMHNIKAAGALQATIETR